MREKQWGVHYKYQDGGILFGKTVRDKVVIEAVTEREATNKAKTLLAQVLKKKDIRIEKVTRQ